MNIYVVFTTTKPTKKTPTQTEEIEYFTRKFYTSAGFSIIKYSEFSQNPQTFPEIESSDFKHNNETIKTLIARKIPKLENYPFKEENGIIFEISPEELREPNQK